jgi:hypothetical protein
MVECINLLAVLRMSNDELVAPVSGAAIIHYYRQGYSGLAPIEGGVV